MKKFFLYILIVVFLSANAQQTTNLVFYTTENKTFTVFLNGIQQNVVPTANIKIINLLQASFNVKIEFQDVDIEAVEKTITFNAGTETSFILKRSSNGKFAMRWQNETPINQSNTAANQTVLDFNSVQANPKNAATTSSTTIITNGNGQVGVKTSEHGMGLDVNINPSQTNSNTTTSQTVVNGNTQQNYVMQGYGGKMGCPWPMTKADFEQVKRSIKAKDFEDSKLTLAKQIAASSCFFAEQVRDIMKLFDFEDTKLQFAKFAYTHTFDMGNYFKVNDAFEFETTIEDLNNYISTQK